MGAREWGLLLLLSALWGGSFFFNEVALRGFRPFTLVACRVLLAALMLHLVLRLRGGRLPLGGNALLAFLGMGILNNAVPFSLIVWGQTEVASGLASILNATTPLFGVLVVLLFLPDERPTWNRYLGVLVGFLGVAFMLGVGALKGLGGNLLGQCAILGAALSYALSGAFGRRFARLGITPLQTAAGQTSAASLLLVPVALLVDAPWALPLPGLAPVASLLALATVSTALAYILYFRILAAAGATSVFLVTFLVPVSAVLLGVLVLGERLAIEHLLGMALIGLGLGLIDGRLFRRLGGGLARPAA
ncbi:MAG: DMT family transporter [Geminicoccaceae bacterium]|nr:DMT family transporter [Geminicoccaceae bacterium]